MKNGEIAAILEELADCLELTGENPFRVNSYRNAARTLVGLSREAEQMSVEELAELPGVGQSMVAKIRALVTTGKLPQHEEMKAKIPPEVIKMLGVSGLGPKTVAMLQKEFAVKTFADLEALLGSGKLESAPGMGEKKVAKIRHGLEIYRRGHERKPLGSVLPVAEAVAEAVRKIQGVEQVDLAGSVRRMCPTVGDVDILARAADGPTAIQAFVRLPSVQEILAQGDTKGAVRLADDLQVDLRIVETAGYGAALQYFTGSKAHGVHCREIAKSKGLTLNEYGVFRGQKRIAGKDEEEVYRAIGLSWVPPEMREDRGEVELAEAHKLPELLEPDQVRGDCHVHSSASDGTRTIEEMAEGCRKLGRQWMVLTDHSQSLKVAGGLSVSALRKQRGEIDKLNEELSGFTILAGTEVDILADGAIDYPDDVLAELDWVVASIHTRLEDPRDTLTRRLVRAMENPHVDAIGHLTGRLIGSRDPMDLDLERIMEAAVRTGTVLEINSQPERLDVTDVTVQEAVKRGVKLCIGTDAHRLEQLGFMRLGVSVARRGWAEPEDVVNTRTAKQLLSWRAGNR